MADPVSPELRRLVMARANHFQLNDARIEPLTPEGRVTVLILQLNSSERVEERRALLAAGLYA